MPSILLTAPAAEPLSLAAAKAYLRVAHDDDDDVITALIAAARIHVEATTRRALITQTWRLSRDAWPRDGRIAVLPAPLRALLAARVYDSDGVAQTIDLQSFVLDIALGGAGGPERRTEIVLTGSGREERNARWAHSRRRYDAGYGVKTFAALSAVVAFFEERRGRLHGFRWRDRLDHSSAAPDVAVTPLDQAIGSGDGAQAEFQLLKTYGAVHAPYQRAIAKPVAGSVRVAVDGVEAVEDTDFTVDIATGIVSFLPGHEPGVGLVVTAGFLFDVPVRFDTDYLEVDLSAFEAGAIPKIPLVEIKV